MSDSIPTATEYFASFLNRTDDPTEISGRLRVQAAAERLVVSDVARKLCLKPDDELLEIGCGGGNLLIPISFSVVKCIGIDHENLTSYAMQRYNGENIEYISGQFPATRPEGKFDKILIYSVLAYMHNREELFDFLSKALEHLSRSGRMLLGDITCSGKKKRFIDSEQGQEFLAKWDEIVSKNPGASMPAAPPGLIEMNDEMVMDILLFFRKKGFHSYVVEQNSELPFGKTREDIVVVGPEYKDT